MMVNKIQPKPEFRGDSNYLDQSSEARLFRGESIYLGELSSEVGQLGVLGCLASRWSDLLQVESWRHDLVDFLLSGALSVHPEPDCVDGNTDHRRARHDVAERMSPPWIMVALVDDVLPSEQLEEEDAGTDERGDDRPASDEEVTWVVADHVVHRESEPPGPKAPRNGNALKEHEEEKTHTACCVFIKQLEHVDAAPGYAGEPNEVAGDADKQDEELLSVSEMLGVLVDDGGDDALHGAELRVQPEEHQHEEEEAAPQGREWHLKHCAWVRQEGKSGS